MGVRHQINFTAKLLSMMVFAALGFAAGFVACTHAKGLLADEDRDQYLRQKGDAPPAVRDGVQAALIDLQSGYTKRNSMDLQLFMSKLFDRDKDVLLEGTDADWARGYNSAAQFVDRDWKYWGNLKLDTKDVVVWSRGDVAWMTTLGVVQTDKNQRPLRFTAILNRDGANWRFRQISFQWEERNPVPEDVLRANTYRRLGELILHRIGLLFNRNL
jgi:hypothetical protein